MKFLYTIAYRILLLWWFIFRPTKIGARAIITNESEDKILLIKQSYLGQWRLPWWLSNRGEDLLHTAVREIYEELHISIPENHAKFLGMYSSIKEYKNDQIAVFICTAKASQIQIDEKEILAAKWFDINNLPSDTTQAVHKRISEWKTSPKQQYFTTW